MKHQSNAFVLDHITVVAKTLEIGTAYVHDQLGVNVPMGGIHPAMGTHNRLMRTGDGEFLEIIAVHPEMERPKRPRWFGLDQSLRQDAVLATWVLGANDIRAQANRSSAEVGEPSLQQARPGARGTFKTCAAGALMTALAHRSTNASFWLR